MQSLNQKKFAPIFGENRKLEVELEGDSTVIRLFDWIEGLGWSCQKTVSLDADLVEDLHRALAAVRCRSGRIAKGENGGKIIDFPTIL